MSLALHIRRILIARPGMMLIALLAVSIVMARADAHVALADPTSTLDRAADPVVLTGAQIPALNIIDLQQIAQSVGPASSPQYIVNMDITKNGSINVVDLQQAAAQFGPCTP